MSSIPHRLTKLLPAIRLCNKAKRGSEGVQVIEDVTFRGRRIQGPAVLFCLEGVVLESCSLYGNPNAIFCEYEGEKVPIGAIVLRNVTFKDSDLKDISIIGPPDEREGDNVGWGVGASVGSGLMAHDPTPDKPVAELIASFDRIGRSIEAVPGWRSVERFLNNIADGFAFGVVLMWALRWYWVVIGLGLLVTGVN
jgi:hypothetical protein